jgi:cytochrome c-type biogenesis protein CcsB
MKKWLPWVLAALCAVWVGSSLLPRSERDFHTRAFGKLPVLLNGRIQPIDSVARNSLLQLRTKQTVRLEGKKKLTATEWLLEVMAKPEVADERKVFRIDNLEVLGLLKLPEHEQYFSFAQLSSSYNEIGKQAERIEKIKAETRSTFEKQLMKLYNGLMLYQRLKVSLRPPNSRNFVTELEAYEQAREPGVAAVRASQGGGEFDQAAYDKILAFLAEYQSVSKFAYILTVPPAEAGAPREDWRNVGSSLMDSVHGGGINAAVKYYAAMTTAYREGQTAQFNQAVQNYRQWLSEKFTPEVNKGAREFFYNDFQAFLKAMSIYVLAFLLGIGSLLTFGSAPVISETLRRSAFWLVVFGGIIHTFGLIFRMALEGRPPVTNLYSSAIFIGWGSLVLGLFLERIYRVGIGIVVASFVGFVTLVIAHNLSLGGDTMEMLRAVLDTNFWLATHVVTITLGYAANFVAGLLAILFIILGIFTPLLRQGMTGRNPAAKGAVASAGQVELGKALAKMVYGIVCFATLFSFVGTVLGGIWADQSWGRFWGWDPKENGALLIVIWNAIVLHARWGGIIRERGLMNLAVFGNIITSFSWFGVNMLGIGLHSYGFMDAAFKWLMLFVATQLAIIGVGLLPLRLWRSFRTSELKAKPTSLGGSTTSPEPAAS